MTLAYFVILVITITESTRGVEYFGQIQQRRKRKDQKYGNSLIRDGFDIKSKLKSILKNRYSAFLLKFMSGMFIIL